MLDSVCGDNERMSRAIGEFDSLVEKNVSQLYAAFCELILHSTNSKAVSIALVDLTHLIRISWDKLDESLHNSAPDFVLELFRILKENDSQLFAQLLSEISLHLMDANFWQTLFAQMRGQAKTAPVVIELLASNQCVPPPEFLQIFMKASVSYTLEALKGSVVYYKYRSIRAVANALNIFPDQYEQFTEHFVVLKSEMEKSVTMSESDFEQFWAACVSLFRVGVIPYEEFDEYGYSALILAAARRKDISAEARLIPLGSFSKILPYTSAETLLEIGKLSTELAEQYVTQASDLPLEFVFFYGNCFECFDHQQIYGAAREIVRDLMNSGVEEKMIVSMCIIKVLLEKTPQQIHRDIDFVTTHVENSLKHHNPLLVRIACKIICVFTKFFARNMVDVEVFLPRTVFLLVHPNNDVRFSASLALERLFAITPVRVPHLVQMMFAVSDKIFDTDRLRFLFLFSEAIDVQMIIEDAEAQQIVEFIKHLITSDSEDYLAGALKISIQLLKCTDNLFSTLVPIVSQLLDMGMSSENVHWKNYATWLLGEFLTVDKEITMELFNKHRDTIQALLEMPDASVTATKEHIAIEVSHINARTPDHPFSATLFALGMTWLESPITTTACAALKLLKRGVLYRPNDQVLAMVRMIAKICCQTKDMAVAIRCFKTLGYIVRQTKGDITAECKAIAGQLCMSFLHGELSVQNGLPPLTTDTDFGLVRELAKQSAFWMNPSKQIQREIFAFSMDVFQRQNIVLMELALQFWSDVVKIGGFIPEEVAQIKGIALEMMKEDIHPTLMMNNSLLVETLISHGLVTWEEMEPKFRILIKWWNSCCEIKHKMRSTMSGILILLLTIIGVFELPLSRFKPVFLEAILRQVPPDDVSRTDQVALMLVKILKQGNVMLEPCIAFVTAICKLLMCSEAVLIRKRRISPEMRADLISVVNKLRVQHKEVQEAINDFVKDDQGRKDRLAALLG